MRIDQIELQAVVSCTPDTRVSAARALLDMHKSDSLLLIEGSIVVGCLDRSDLARQNLYPGLASDRQPIGPYAHGCRIHATPDMDVATVLNRMQRHRTPVLPVRLDGKIVGMVSSAQLAAV